MKKIKNIIRAISPVEWLIIIGVLILFWIGIYSVTNYTEVTITVKDMKYVIALLMVDLILQICMED